jgi:hypothetical protein
MSSRLEVAAALAGITLALGGCMSLGARRLPDDRVDYNEALRESDAALILTNVVALRFGENPSFLSVYSIVSQYERNGFLNPITRIPPYNGDPAATLSGQAFLRETPTITYTPVTGDKFVHSVLEPMPPQALLSMLEAGWPVDRLFRFSVRSINGVRNESRAPIFAQAGDPEFEQALGALRRLQRTNKLSIRVTKHETKQEKTFTAHALVGGTLSETEQADLALVKRALRMGSAAFMGEVPIVAAERAATPNELAIATRSMLEVLQIMSLGVDVTGQGRFDPGAPVRVHSGPRRPDVVYAAIHRRGRWYWIASDDTTSQHAIMLAEVLMVVNAQAEGQAAPVITIPAG